DRPAEDALTRNCCQKLLSDDHRRGNTSGRSIESSDGPELKMVVPRGGFEPPRPCGQRFECDYAQSAVVRRRALQYGNRPRGPSSVRRRSSKFALTAVKLLSGAARGRDRSERWLGRPPDWYRRG